MTPETVTAEYYAHKLGDRKPSRASATWASNLGHPCTAYVALTRVAGEKAEPIDAKLACIFAEGNLQEQAVKIDLQQMGFKLSQAERRVFWDKYEISGKLDGYLSRNGERGVQIEIKSCSPFVFHKFNSFEDIKTAKKYFYRKWAAQLMIYMLLEGEEVGWFILKNKATGELKILAADLDLGFAESLIKKAEEIKAGVAEYDKSQKHSANFYWEEWLKPHRLNDPEICLECPLKATCLPEIDAGAGVYFANDGAMAETLKQWEDTEKASDDHADLDKEIKTKAKKVFEAGSKEIICGDFIIKGNKIEPKGKTPYFRIDISRLGKPVEV